METMVNEGRVPTVTQGQAASLLFLMLVADVVAAVDRLFEVVDPVEAAMVGDRVDAGRDGGHDDIMIGVLKRSLADGTYWRALGDGRYRCVRADPVVGLLYVAIRTTPDGQRMFRYDSIADNVVRFGAAGVERAWRRVQAALDEYLLPVCLAPGCTDKGRVLFHAAGVGRLGGVLRRPGDELRLCAPHAAEVHRAQAAVTRGELPRWLATDVPHGAFADEMTEDESARVVFEQRILPVRYTRAGDPVNAGQPTEPAGAEREGLDW